MYQFRSGGLAVMNNKPTKRTRLNVKSRIIFIQCGHSGKLSAKSSKVLESTYRVLKEEKCLVEVLAIHIQSDLVRLESVQSGPSLPPHYLDFSLSHPVRQFDKFLKLF